MRYLVAFLLTGCFVLSVSAQDEVDARINGIGAGTLYSAVIKKIGKPLRVNENGFGECAGGFLKTLYYEGFEIEFLSEDKRRNYTVTSMTLTSPKWSIAPEVRIGTDKKDVRAKYGQPNGVSVRKSGVELFSYTTKANFDGVYFYFRNNKLIRVEMFRTFC
jgi:hypothetical protein